MINRIGGFNARRLEQQIQNQIPVKENPLPVGGGEGVEKKLTEAPLENRTIEISNEGLGISSELSGESNPEGEREEQQAEQILSAQEANQQLESLQNEEEILRQKLREIENKQEEAQSAQAIAKRREMLGLKLPPRAELPQQVQKQPERSAPSESLQSQEELPELPLRPIDEPTSQAETPVQPNRLSKQEQDDFEFQMLRSRLEGMPPISKPKESAEENIEAAIEQELGKIPPIGSPQNFEQTSQTQEMDAFNPEDTLDFFENMDETIVDSEPTLPTQEIPNSFAEAFQDSIDANTVTLENPLDETQPNQKIENPDDLNIDHMRYQGRGIKG